MAEIVPERLDAPSVPLEIAAVVTSSLGKRGYNAVRVGETFAVASSSSATGRFTTTRRVKVC